MHGLVRGTPPWIDLKRERAVQRTCIQAVQKGLISSAHDLSEGGLAVALAESCFCGPGAAMGAIVELDETMRRDALLFGETQSCILLSLNEKDLGRVKAIAAREKAPLQVIGKVGGSQLSVGSFFQLPVEELKAIWSQALGKRFS
jgi:phosphoribosylformylglycinamidine synthase